MPDPAPIPFPAIAKFIRLHTHDLRNELNALDLEATLLGDLVPAGEGSEALCQLRRQLRATAAQLRELCARFHDPSPQIAPWPARELFDHCRQSAAPVEGNAASPAPLEWEAQLGEETVSADIESFTAAWLELVRNAVVFREGEATLSVKATVEGGRVIFRLSEEKTAAPDFNHWGTPFQTTRRDGYGLGLYHAQRLLSAQGARVSREYAQGHLVTTVSLPLAGKA